MSHKGTTWYYNPETDTESQTSTPLPPPWIKGRKKLSYKKKWYYNPETGEEKAVKPPLPPPWKRGRLPYSLWSEERKQSYRKKHTNYNITEKSKRIRSQNFHKANYGKAGYTNGTNNIVLRIGEIVPEGYYKGWIHQYKDKEKQ